MADVLSLMGYVQQQGEIGRARGERRTIGDLLGRAYEAPASERGGILGQIARANPDAVPGASTALRADSEDMRKQLVWDAKVLSSADPSMQPQIYAGMRNRLKSVYGIDAPEQFDERVLATAKQLAAMDTGGTPAGIREHEYMTQGLSQEDQIKARRIALGLDGRASSAGFKFIKFKDSQGSEHVGAFNGATGRIDTPSGLSFDPSEINQIPDVPITANAPAPQRGGISLNIDPARLEGSSVEEIVRMAVQDYQNRGAAVNPTMQPTATTPPINGAGGVAQPPAGAMPGYNPGYPGQRAGIPRGDMFTGPTPGNVAAQQEAAKQRAQLDAMPERNQLEAAGAEAREVGVQRARLGAKREEERIKRVAKLDNIIGRQRMVTEVIDDALAAPGFDANFGLDSARRFIPGTEAANAKTRISTVFNQIRLNVLSDLKELSATGGAVGQVSNEEGRIMAGYLGELENSVTDEEARRVLGKIKERMAGMADRMRAAIERDMAEQGEAQDDAPADPSRGNRIRIKL